MREIRKVDTHGRAGTGDEGDTGSVLLKMVVAREVTVSFLLRLIVSARSRERKEWPSVRLLREGLKVR